MSLLNSVEIAGVCGAFARPENKKQGLHRLAEMASETQHAKDQKQIEQVFEAYDNMLDGMGLGRDNFKVSDWDYVQSLKAKIKEE